MRDLTRSEIIKAVDFYFEAAITAQPAVLMFDNACLYFAPDDDVTAASLGLAFRKFDSKLTSVSVLLIATPDLSAIHESLTQLSDLRVSLDGTSKADVEWILERGTRMRQLPFSRC